MATDVIGVWLRLHQIRVLEVVVDTADVLRVRVESTETRPRCPDCGFKEPARKRGERGGWGSVTYVRGPARIGDVSTKDSGGPRWLPML